MIGHVKPWGNSLALRIPHALVKQLDLAPDTALELSVHDGILCAKPVVETFPTLDELLARIPEGTEFDEVDWGGPAGREAW